MLNKIEQEDIDLLKKIFNIRLVEHFLKFFQ